MKPPQAARYALIGLGAPVRWRVMRRLDEGLATDPCGDEVNWASG